jgi:hypothetical protein
VLYNEKMDFERFKNTYSSWQKVLADGLVGCLQAKPKNPDDAAASLRLRAALALLNRMVRIFPTNPAFGDRLRQELKLLQDDDSRPDMKPIFNAYLAQLTKAMNEGCWKEQTVAQRREREKEEQAKIDERKKRQKELRREMDVDMAQVDLELGNDNRARGVTDRRDTRFGRGEGGHNNRKNDGVQVSACGWGCINLFCFIHFLFIFYALTL